MRANPGPLPVKPQPEFPHGQLETLNASNVALQDSRLGSAVDGEESWREESEKLQGVSQTLDPRP
eukprot:2216139-Rhodomonas_salina.1